MEGRSLIIVRALDKPTLEIVKQKYSDAADVDRRNLHLANEGCTFVFDCYCCCCPLFLTVVCLRVCFCTSFFVFFRHFFYVLLFFSVKKTVITRDQAAMLGVSAEDMAKREASQKEKKKKLQNTNYYVSRTRLSIRNLPSVSFLIYVCLFSFTFTFPFCVVVSFPFFIAHVVTFVCLGHK